MGRIDRARAELIRRRLEVELALRDPAVRDVELPEPLREFAGAPAAAAAPVATGPSAEEVLRQYVAYIQIENAPHHSRNKTTHLARFFGTRAVAGADGECGRRGASPKSRRRRGRPEEPGVFKGKLFAEVSAADVQAMIDALPAGKKTKRHYRNTFHALFEFAMKRGHFAPTNFRYPNPMSALPTYHEKNGAIVFLAQAQIDEVLRVLEPCPPARIAAALMIYGGLRRAEALWLRCRDVSPDLRFLSVINKTDEDKDIESSLKTGQRSVPVIPELRAILEPCLAAPGPQWLCPSPTGHQWDGDNFARRHRQMLADASLHHTCLHYRHTFATQRAAQGWSLFTISKVMGNSVAVCERYYAAFIAPSAD